MGLEIPSPTSLVTLASRAFASLTAVRVLEGRRRVRVVSTVKVTLGRYSRGRRRLTITVDKKAALGADYRLQGMRGRRPGKMLPYRLTVAAAKRKTPRRGGNSRPGTGANSRPGTGANAPATMPAGSGFDAMYLGGSGESFSKSYRSLAPLGRLYVFGASVMVSGKRRSILNVLRHMLRMPKWKPIGLMDDNRGVHGVNVGHLWDEIAKLRRMLDEIVELTSQGKLQPIVDRTFPFTEASEAHAYIQDRRRLGERKAAALRSTGADWVITTNPGCTLQLEAHLGKPEDPQVQSFPRFLASRLAPSLHE